MSMYNLSSGGPDPVAPALVAMLQEVQAFEIPRFRDAELNADGTQIVIRTRTGGGNRECFCEEGIFHREKKKDGSHFPDCYPYLNDLMAKHPLYVSDEDDDFDSTYAYFRFKVPEKYLAATKAVATGKDPKGMGEITEAFVKRIESMTPEELRSDPALGPTTKKLEKLAKELR